MSETVSFFKIFPSQSQNVITIVLLPLLMKVFRNFLFV